MANRKAPAELFGSYPIVLVEPVRMWTWLAPILMGMLSVFMFWGAFFLFRDGCLPLRATPMFIMSFGCAASLLYFLIFYLVDFWGIAKKQRWLKLDEDGISFTRGWGNAINFYNWYEIREFSVESYGRNSYLTGKYRSDHPEVLRRKYSKKHPRGLGFTSFMIMGLGTRLWRIS